MKLSSEAFDLVLLDWMPPWRDGIEILKLLRQHGTKPPVLLLTARDAVEDRVLGLDSRADDYLVKPFAFAFAELLARLRALLRRSGQDEVLRKQIGDLVLDLRTRQAWRDSDEFVSAIAKANVVSPSGNMNLGDSYPIVPTNAIVTKPSELADVALRSEADGAVFVRDVATVAARLTSAVVVSRRLRAVGFRAIGEPDDPRRAGSISRYPCGRGDGGHREHPHPACRQSLSGTCFGGCGPDPAGHDRER